MYSAPTSFSTIHCTTSTPRASTSPPGTCRMACRIPDRGAGFAGAAQAAPAREPLLRTFVGQRQADVRQLPVQPAPGRHEHHRAALVVVDGRSEEHTSELQSLMRISSAVFCLKKKKPTNKSRNTNLDRKNQHQTAKERTT